MNAFALILNSFWQAAAIVAVMWGVLRSMPRVNAATRYLIWWALLLLVLLLPLAMMMTARHTNLPGTPVASGAGAAVNPLLPEPAITAMVTLRPAPSSKWPFAIVVIWSAVFLYSLARTGCSWLYVRAVKARATLCPQTLPPIGRSVKVLLSAEVLSPMAVGFGEPAVILPESLPSDLEPAGLQHVLLHETAHLARYDDWTNLVARLLAGAVALHPVALWILRQIEREREIACDEWVVALTGHAHAYAASLAKMYERRWAQKQVLATGIFGRDSGAVQRIELLVKRGREFSSQISISRIALSCVAILVLAAVTSRAPYLVVFAQQAQRSSFEVASIKPGNPNERGPKGVGTNGNQFMARDASLRLMIQVAYGLQDHQIVGGPNWIDSDLFTIDAKPNAATPLPDPNRRADFDRMINLMLQSLLEERFKLAVHRETRMEPIYELVVAKGGPKLKESAGPDANGRQGIFGRPGYWAATNQGIGALVGVLSQQLGRPVRDKTGITGRYDYTLTYMPEPTQPVPGAPQPEAFPPVDSNAPSIFTALQEQLGLKLESTRGPVEVLVVDNAEKPEPN
jgi:bla regulator protein BlaR1